MRFVSYLKVTVGFVLETNVTERERHFASLTERSVLDLVHCWTKAAHPVNIQLYIHEISCSSRVFLLSWDKLRLSSRGFIQVLTLFWGSVHHLNIRAAAGRWVSGFLNVWSCQNWLSNTHTYTHLERRCVCVQSRGTKMVEVPTSVEVIRDTTVQTWNDSSLCWSHTRSSNTRDNQTCCLLAINALISLFSFQFNPADLDIICLILRISLLYFLFLFWLQYKDVLFPLVDLMADGQEDVFPRLVFPFQSLSEPYPPCFFQHRHTRPI